MVDILMATYNGAQYIEAQILSIIGQSHKEWRLLVHDDGSSDQTVAIVKRLAAKDGRIVLVEDNIRCGGSAPNFLHLAAFADAPYVMFADQDDIWFDNKVAFMLDQINQRDNTCPQVLYSSLYVWKPDQGIVGQPVRAKAETLSQFLFLNTAIHGCVSMFNRHALTLLQQWKGISIMHDCSLQLIGLAFGQIAYLDTPLMLYRRHDNSVTGDTITQLNDLKRLSTKTSIPVLFEGYYQMVAYFLKAYRANFSSSDVAVLEAFLAMRHQSTGGRIRSVYKRGFMLYGSRLRLIIKLMARKYIG